MRHVLKTVLTAILLPLPAAAQDPSDLVRVEVLPGWREDNGTHIAAVQITLAPGWVTYWRAPGDGGISPQFEFTGDPAIRSIDPHWPVPEVFDDAGMISIGYYDGVTFPLMLDLPDDAGPVSLSGEMTIGICDEVCIPVSFNFDTLLPEIGAANPDIASALADRAMTADEAATGDVTCQIDPISDGLRLRANIPLAESSSKDYVVVETSDPSIWVSQADVTRDGGMISAVVDLVAPTGKPFALDRSGLRFTVLDDSRAIDILGCSAG